jgi:hypothetical protein
MLEDTDPHRMFKGHEVMSHSVLGVVELEKYQSPCQYPFDYFLNPMVDKKV